MKNLILVLAFIFASSNIVNAENVINFSDTNIQTTQVNIELSNDVFQLKTDDFGWLCRKIAEKTREYLEEQFEGEFTEEELDNIEEGVTKVCDGLM